MNSELHALTGAYAVDALDDLERARFERHLSECTDCSAEVHSLRAAAGELSHVVGAGPSTLVRDRVLAEIRTVRPLAPVPAPVQVVRRKARRFPPLVAAAVAALVLVIGGGVAALHPWQEQPTVAAVAVPQRVMDASDARTQTTVATDGSRVTLYHSRSVNRSVLVTDLKAVPLGKAYELWYLKNNVYVPAGMMADGGRRTVVLHGALGSAKGVGITVEPAAGSNHPTSAPVASFRLSQSV